MALDLYSYEDVSQHADAILAKLRDGSMRCDGAWRTIRSTVSTNGFAVASCHERRSAARPRPLGRRGMSSEALVIVGASAHLGYLETPIGGRYLGSERVEEYGRGNAVPPERVVHVKRSRIVAPVNAAG